MKVLWIVNTVFPYPAKKMNFQIPVFGGWMLGLMNSLTSNDKIELAVVTTYNTGKEFKEFYDGKVRYYLLPTCKKIKYDQKLGKYYKVICEKFNPDFVHFHGTEFPYGLVFMNACPRIQTIVSIQGLISECGKVYLSGINNFDVIKSITFRDIVKLDNLFQQKRRFDRRGVYEIEILKRSDCIIGRTSWDYSKVLEITDISKYRKCNETLREGFYNYTWNYNKAKKNTIFVSQASYPIKGFHILIKALPIIKKVYPDIMVYVSGSNIIDRNSFNSKLRLTGYGKYIISLMKKNGVDANIKFVGLLDEIKTIKKMLECNVFVQASVLENSSNSLGEAMLLGMPIVASNVGGTKDLLHDGEEGLLYSSMDETMLADCVINILKDNKKAIKFGEKARKHALITHDKAKNLKDMLDIYNEIKKRG